MAGLRFADEAVATPDPLRINQLDQNLSEDPVAKPYQKLTKKPLFYKKLA
jgi:hypothetical protein